MTAESENGDREKTGKPTFTYLNETLFPETTFRIPVTLVTQVLLQVLRSPSFFTFCIVRLLPVLKLFLWVNVFAETAT